MKSLFIQDSKSTSQKTYFFNIVLVLTLFSILVWFSFSTLGYDLRWSSVWEYRYNLFSGFGITILLSLVSLVVSIIIGVFFGLAQRSSIISLKIISRGYIEIIRGTPLLVQVLIFYYVVANAIGIDDRFVVGVLIMSIFSGAYIAEIIRSGIESVSKSQLETAVSLGFTRVQIYRYIIFPQVITRIMPPLAGQLAALIKDSSLLSIIAIKEFTMAAREINAATFSTLESYLPLAIGYLLLTIPISVLTRKLEKRFKYET
jgi:polar amino acid transport system permease protein